MKEKDLYNSFNSIKTNDEQKSKMLDHILNPNNDFKTVKKSKAKIGIGYCSCLYNDFYCNCH